MGRQLLEQLHASNGPVIGILPNEGGKVMFEDIVCIEIGGERLLLDGGSVEEKLIGLGTLLKIGL